MMARLGNGHVNVVRPHEIVLTGRYVMTIVEYVRGGSVADFLKKARMDEDLACYLFRQLLDAVGFVHARKIAYRDVKPANCLLTSPGWPPLLKLADFGLSETWEGREAPVFETLAGTPGYMPPEILGGFFSPDARLTYDGVKADVYSCGVMLAVLLMRHLPWEYDAYAARLPPLEAMRALWQLEGVDGVTWRNATSEKRSGRLSEGVKDLLDKMLAADDTKRPTLDEIRAHPWVSRPLPAEYEAVLETLAARQAKFEAAAPVSDAEIAERLSQAEEVAKRAAKTTKGLRAAFACEMRVQMAPTAPQGIPIRRDSQAVRVAVESARANSGELPPRVAPT
jgi:serine/threonine-protein kinase SRK2